MRLLESPLALGKGLIARNRIVVPPMASETASEAGLATENTYAHYERLAAAGAGITMVEYTYVSRSGRSEERQLGLASDEHAAALAGLASRLAQTGTIPGIQLTHGGGKSSRELTGGLLHAPSAVRVPVKGKELEEPSPLSSEGIAEWMEVFACAAERAADLGFRIVEIHAAHGYGFNQWLSPFTNRRLDRYGGDAAGRRRMLLETVRTIAARVPEVMLAVRVPGRDFLEGGLLPEEVAELCLELEAAGVGIIDVSSGLGGWKRPPDRSGEGYLLPEAAFLKARLQVPVIGVGGLKSAASIESALRAGKMTLAAVGRAILADPSGWRVSAGL